MGKPKRRVNPEVVCRVDRNLKLLTLGAAVKLVSKLPPPFYPCGRGRKPADPRLITVLCLLMVSSNWTYDKYSAERSDPRILKILGVSSLPSRSALHRGMQKLPQDYLRKLNKKIVKRLISRFGLSVIVDATGFRLRTSSAWYDIRIKRKNKRKDNVKLHLAIDPNRNAVLNFKITPFNRGDSPQLAFLLKGIKHFTKLFADSAYLSRKNCELVAEKNGKPFIKIKSNTTKKPKGSQAWKDMVRFAIEEPELFDKIYHLRSLVESVNSAIKRRYGSTIKATKRRTKNNTLALRVIAYNIKQILYDTTATKLGKPYWKPV